MATRTTKRLVMMAVAAAGLALGGGAQAKDLTKTRNRSSSTTGSVTSISLDGSSSTSSSYSPPPAIIAMPVADFGLACQGAFAGQEPQIAGVIACAPQLTGTTLDLFRRAAAFTFLGGAIIGDAKPPVVAFTGVPAPGTYTLADDAIARLEASVWFLRDGAVHYYTASKNGLAHDQGSVTVEVTSVTPATAADGSATWEIHGSYTAELLPHRAYLGSDGSAYCDGGSIPSSASGTITLQGTF